jgi:hypothetical protein
MVAAVANIVLLVARNNDPGGRTGRTTAADADDRRRDVWSGAPTPALRSAKTPIPTPRQQLVAMCRDPRRPVLGSPELLGRRPTRIAPSQESNRMAAVRRPPTPEPQISRRSRAGGPTGACARGCHRARLRRQRGRCRSRSHHACRGGRAPIFGYPNLPQPAPTISDLPTARRRRWPSEGG